MPPWWPCPRTSVTFMPTIPIAASASLTTVSFSSRKIASIFLNMIHLLSSKSGISPFAVLTDIKAHLFFIFRNSQAYPAVEEFGKHKRYAECKRNRHYRGEGLHRELARVAIEQP